MDKVWILTTEYNEYNQNGEYFVAWFPEKPTDDQLKIHGCDHLGRKNWENQWFVLREVDAG